MKKLKKYTNLPIISGFGIKTENDVKKFSNSNCSGIVIGSAIVEKIQQNFKEKKDKHIVANIIKDYCKN